MACNTRSSSKFKDVENNNGRHSSSSASGANDLKRSARKTSLRVFSIPSGTRKSERLLERTTPTNTKRRKFERSKKPKMPSPMRRSKRIKKDSTLMTEDIAPKCKTDSFRFVEYWLPVQISEVQLEHYCSTLVSNASVLRSSSKNDSIGALQDLLISTRKCCNHPYVVDPLLQTLLTKGLRAVDYLDVGIKASGKLQVLDSMLMELKKRGLRVLILFQSVAGSRKDSIGDILDDFLLQRFGSDAYERVDKGVLHSKKLDALTQFNNNESRRFIFLLEACACFPSIKLSSVDIIIIFNSDWNPVNDIRSLQRITLDSQSEQIKIFRLYSCFTVEENILILAKQGKILESNLLNMSWSMSHMLLMWGSSCLFDNLRLIHDGESSSSCSNYSFEDPGQLFKEALREFSSLLLQDSGCNDTISCSIILKVQLNEGKYCTNFALLGEKKLGSPGEGLPNLFWTKLLKGKVPQWKDSCDSSQRTRRRAHHDGGSLYAPNFEREEIARKRRKVIANAVDEPPSNFQGGKSSTGNEEGNKAEYERRKLCDEQRSLHLLLMPGIAKLCEILLLPDNVKAVVDNLLECIMNNHHISRESDSILQAFQISLCWTAASLLKHKIHHKVSLMLAREHLKFGCEKEEADYMYSMLQCLKKIFLYRAENSNAIGVSKPSESPNKVYSCTRVAPEVELIKKDIAKSIKEIQKKCQKKLRKLLLRQDEEKNKLNQANEEKKAVFREIYKMELAVIRYCYSNDAIRSEKLKLLDKEFSERIEDLECQHGILLKELEAVQMEARQKFQCREATWIEEVKYWAQEELKIFLSNEFGSGLKYAQISDQAQPHDGSKNVGIVSDHVDEGPIAGSYGGSISRNDGRNKAENVSENQGHIVSTLSYSKKHNSNGASDGAYESDGQNNSCYSCSDNTVNLVLPSSEGKICDGKTLDASIQEVAIEVHNTDTLGDGWDEVPSTREGDLCQTVLSNPDCGFSLGSNVGGSGDGMDTSLNSQSSPAPMPSATAVCMPNCDDAVQIHEANESSDLDRLATFSSSSSEDRIADAALGVLSERELPREISLRPIGTDSPSHGSDIIYENNSLSLEQQTLGEIPTEVLENSQGVNECYNDKENQTEATMLNAIASSDQQGGIFRTIYEDSLSMEIPVSCSHSEQPLLISSPVVAVKEVPHDLCTSSFTSHKIADEDVGVGEVQNPSQAAERLSSPVNDVAIQSNPESLVMETAVEVQQLSLAAFLGSNQDATEKVQNASRQAESVSTSFSSVRVTQTNPDSLLRNSLEQVQTLHFAESLVSNRDLAEEVQNFSQEVEPLSNPVDVVLSNQSNCESLVMEPLMQNASSDHQGGISRTINEDSVSMEISVSCSHSEQPLAVSSPVVAVNEVPHDLCTSSFTSHKIADGDVGVGEVQNPSQAAERLSSPVDDVAIQSNPESLVMETTVEVQQLSPAEFLVSNWDATEKVQNATRLAELVSTSFSSVPVTQTNPDSLLRNSLEQVQTLHSAESPVSNRDLAEEMQNFSQEVEPLSNPVDVVLPNQSICESLVMEPLMQDQQLPASESSSSNQDIVEDVHSPSPQDNGQVMANRDLVKGLLSVEQPSSNENTVEELQSSSRRIVSVCCPVDCTPHARANSETLVMEPLEHAQQLVSVALPSSSLHIANLPLAPTTEDQRISEDNVSSQVFQAIDEVPSQVVVQLDSMTPTGGRTHWSNIIDRSTPEISSQPIQTATQSASMMPPPLFVDPLELEMEKILNETHQAVKYHENVKLQLKSDHEKELNEIVRKYNTKVQGIEVEYRQKQKDLDENMKKTVATMDLAKVISSKWWGPKLIDENFVQQFLQPHGEQSAFRSSLGVGPSSWVPPATTPQSGFPMVGSQPVTTPIQSSYGTTGNFSNVYAWPPQVVNIHSFPPYPGQYGSSTSMPTTSYSALVRGMSNRLIPSNIPPTSLSFPHLSPQPTPPTYRVDPRNRGQWPLSSNGINMNYLMNVANQFGFNSQNVRPHM